jgi:hypothetical protein
MWAGHYSIRVMIPAVALIVFYNAAGRPGGDNGVFSWVVSGVWILWFATVILDFSYHEERLCERCIAATPLDPQKAVTRWDRFLRLYHHMRVVKILTFAIIVWFFAGPWVGGHHWWAYAINVVAFLLIGVTFTMTHTHRRLYPWCPYCKWGGRGEPEVVPDPDPAASAS